MAQVPCGSARLATTVLSLFLAPLLMFFHVQLVPVDSASLFHVASLPFTPYCYISGYTSLSLLGIGIASHLSSPDYSLLPLAACRVIFLQHSPG